MLLLGFTSSVAYAVVYRLWLERAAGWLPMLQTVAHQVGAALLALGLLLLHGKVASAEGLKPLLGLGSLGSLVGAALMLYLALAGSKPQSDPTPTKLAQPGG